MPSESRSPSNLSLIIPLKGTSGESVLLHEGKQSELSITFTELLTLHDLYEELEICLPNSRYIDEFGKILDRLFEGITKKEYEERLKSC